MKNFLITFAVILGLAGAGYGIYSPTAKSTQTTSNTPSQSAQSSSIASPNDNSSNGGTTVTQAELAKNNGKNGTKCWVAVSGTVYDVSGSREWVNGEHVPSNGAAKCGQDETSVISQSPHGTSVLSNLPVVGSLQ